MIFSVVIEGGCDAEGHYLYDDSFNLFFSANDRLDASDKLAELREILFAGKAGYEAYNLNSELELLKNSSEPYRFRDSHLIEIGFSEGKPLYSKDNLIFLVGHERKRLMDALAIAAQL